MKLLAIRTCLSCGDRFVLADGMNDLRLIFPHETLVRCHQWKCDSVDVRIDIKLVPEDLVIDLPHCAVVDVVEAMYEPVKEPNNFPDLAYVDNWFKGL